MRRFQFSLRTLLIAVAIMAIPCAYVGYQAKIVRERKSMMARIEDLGGGEWTLCCWRPNLRLISHVRRWFGDRPIQTLEIPTSMTGAQGVEEIKTLFPEAKLVDDKLAPL